MVLAFMPLITGPVRCIVLIFIASSIISSKILSIGADRTKPFPMWRRKMIKNCLRLHGSIGDFILIWLWVSDRDVEFDYSEYLGPNWKEEAISYRESGK
jgi:hypothetical protein